MPTIEERVNTEHIDAIATRRDTIIDRARGLPIVDQQTYEQAATDCKAMHLLIQEINLTFDDIIADANTTHKKAIAKRDSHRKPLADALKTRRQDIIAWEHLQEEKAQKAKMEAIATAEQQAKKEAKEAALEAKAAGASNDVVKAILAAPAPLPIQLPETEHVKITGTGARVAQYKGVVLNIDKLIIAAGKNPALRAYLQINQTALNQAARSQNTRFAVPGCSAVRG